ncbi:auxin-responsive protein SAUR61-like [Curcuma longa]|uniref:auxin-responsive protein SAUR61-like n=1 Tax=Curcuma longa TaxID=136217 RepID=UPI003D9F34F3
MLSPKRFVEKAKKGVCSGNGMVAIAKEGHFVVCSVDGTRFMLLEVSAEEFGSPSEGPITLACSRLFVQYILSMLRGNMSRDVVEKMLLASIDANRCWTPC